MEENGKTIRIKGHGNGPIDAFFQALKISCDVGDLKLSSYSEHALSEVPIQKLSLISRLMTVKDMPVLESVLIPVLMEHH
jgi:hypothetical protein